MISPLTRRLETFLDDVVRGFWAAVEWMFG